MKRLFLVMSMLLINMAVIAQPGGGGMPGGGMSGGGMPGGGGPGGGGGGRPPMSMGNQQKDEFVRVRATAITEMFKKELKLDTKQYPKFRKAYISFINVRLSNPDAPDAGMKKLDKSLKKLLDAGQFRKWKELAPSVKIPEMRQGPPPGNGMEQNNGMEPQGMPPR